MLPVISRLDAWATYCARVGDTTDKDRREFLKVWQAMPEGEQAQWIQKRIELRRVRRGRLYEVGGKRIRIVGFEKGSGLSSAQPIVSYVEISALLGAIISEPARHFLQWVDGAWDMSPAFRAVAS